MYGSVYLITELDTGKVYVGQTTMTIKRRWASYCSRPIKNHYVSELIYRRGSNAFKIEELMDAVDRAELNKWEQFYIEYFQSYKEDKGYNKSLGGFGAGKITEDTRRKFKTNCKPPSQKGKTTSPETRARISKSKQGVAHRNKRKYTEEGLFRVRERALK